MNTIRAEIHFPYFKQGDDLQMAIDSAKGDPLEGLEFFAVNAEAVAEQARAIKDLITVHPDAKEIAITGCTHQITISGPADLIDMLIEAKLAFPNPWDDDEPEIEERDLEIVA